MRNSDKAMMRIAVLDCVDRVMTRTPQHADFAEYLGNEVIDRVLSGRSSDCDAYRELQRFDAMQS